MLKSTFLTVPGVCVATVVAFSDGRYQEYQFEYNYDYFWDQVLMVLILKRLFIE